MTGTEYNRAIVQHLGDSEKLIVVCSPGARASTLTMRFGALWKLTKLGNIIPVLLEGIPNNAAEGGPEELMDFPAALCAATGYFFPKINQVRISDNRKARCMLCKKRLS